MTRSRLEMVLAMLRYASKTLESDGVSNSRLYTVNGINASIGAPMILNLVKHGYLEITKRHKGKRFKVGITEKGRNTFKTLERIKNEIVEESP